MVSTGERSMSIQIYQLLSLALYAGLAVAFWKINKKWVRISIAVAAFVVFAVNPVRFEQENMAIVEQGGTSFIAGEMPARVEVEIETYDEKLQREMNVLKQQSEGIQNEIHD